MPPPNEHERPSDVSTWLVIPYHADDFGRPGQERPLDPGKAISWLCPAIIIDGSPGKTSFVRGVPTSVTVDVANWGAGGLTAPVQVRVFWADPTLAFTAVQPFGQAVLLARSGAGPVQSRPIVGTIPTSAPAHVCLIVHVAAPMDASPVGAVPDPAGDRHWAQLNLLEVTANEDGAFDFSADMGNPFGTDMVARFRLQAIHEGQIGDLSHRLGRDVDSFEPSDVQVSVAGERIEGEIPLRPHDRRSVQVFGRLQGLSPGRSVVLTLAQTIREDTAETGLEASLGVLVRGA